MSSPAQTPIPQPGQNCWRVERADRASLIVDAADYFRLARQAMLRAEKQILLIGWDFDTRICLDYDAQDDAPAELGAFLSWLPKHRPGLQIHILKWDLGAIKLLGRGTTVLRLARWAASSQIHFKLDGAHAVGASHHHKIVVIDDRLAFCGGIDMTADRWDTRAHLDGDEHRQRPTTRPPLRPVARCDHGGRRQGRARRSASMPGSDGRPPAASRSSRPPPSSDPWPDELDPHFATSTSPSPGLGGSMTAGECVREIEALYVDMVRSAKRFVYAENQYFASRVVAKAIAKRLQEPDPPEFVIVNPHSADGWLEDEVDEHRPRRADGACSQAATGTAASASIIR